MSERKQKRPLVSVVMAAYNAQAYIRDSIASVQGQTISDWELLVIDDCSTDGTRELVRTLAEADGRIQLVCNETNQGTAATRNRGFELCRGEFVALLDSDDCWRPEKLEKQLALAEQTGAELIFTSYAIMDAQGRPCCRDYIVPGQTDVKRQLRENVIGCSTVLLRREMVEQFHFSRAYYHEDYVLWLEILRAGYRAVGVTDVLMDYRLHQNSRASNKGASARRRWQIYRSFMKLSVPQSAVCLIGYMVSGAFKYRRL